MKNNTSRKSGFTLVEIMIVVAIIGLLAAIAIPNFVRARTQSQKNACINNLRQIDGAVQQWALENKAAPDAAFPGDAVILGYLKNEVKCPAGGTDYASSYGTTTLIITNKPVCNILGTAVQTDTTLAHVLVADTTQ
jgi:prepilin-type N-terminal cleavage/methylation domain-containing protein